MEAVHTTCYQPRFDQRKTIGQSPEQATCMALATSSGLGFRSKGEFACLGDSRRFAGFQHRL